MGRHKFGGGAVRCEVCVDKVTHQNSDVVGRKASGTARVVHKRTRCWRKWEQNKEAIMATWVELKPPASPASPPAELTPPQPPTPPSAQEVPPMPSTQAPKRGEGKRYHWVPQPELLQWLVKQCDNPAFLASRYGATILRRELEALSPALLLDAQGNPPSDSQFGDLWRRTRDRYKHIVEAQRLMAGKVAPTVPTQPTPPPPAPVIKLVPVPDVKDLQRQVEKHAASADTAWKHVSHLSRILTRVAELAATGDGDTLAAVADMLERP